MAYIITASKPGDAAIVQRNTASEALQVVGARRAAGYTKVEVSHHNATLTDTQLVELAAKEEEDPGRHQPRRVPPVPPVNQRG